jgi:hypothetical protein
MKTEPKFPRRFVFALMVAIIWITCCIVAIALRDPEVMSHAEDITLCCGIGYVLTA